MDPATLIGVLLAFLVVIVANVMEGGNPMSLVLLPPLLLVFGATLLVSFAGGTVADAKLALRGLKHAFTGKAPTANQLVPELVTLAEKARREGLLALEDAVAGLDDPFLVRALTLAIDGTDPEELRDILESEVVAQRAEAKQAAKFFAAAGGYAPTIGIVGTVMGLVHVLEQLAEPEKLGHLIAGAFVATLWGVLSANLLFLPIAARLQRLGELEVARMELVIEGVSALQAGSNPRLVAQRLRSLLPSAQRDEEAA
ncbi:MULTISPECIES: motility protein A [unclassified Nocardioides]|uniref:motility protein A n=1 Tax=unclassified Nocardioides TaxID=2615069 RepID=UPI0009F0E6C5|nr:MULTISPECIES: MotA/TolQ/ExbB proton channel family protein [unclassified Nocardioides]GAW51222.1 MotA/TolQ/ExbB proton channel [Nocardioides sp. PD653-B2]GAW56950.1 MotA/TolQ/ExbB proton channel [Nocardioides sp. PD653]